MVCILVWLREIFEAFEPYVWPLVIWRLVACAIKKLPDYFGVIAYKRLAYLTNFKDCCYQMSEVIRSRVSSGKLEDTAIAEIYDELKKYSSTTYNLSNMIRQYKTWCPALEKHKLQKLNFKAKTPEDKRKVIQCYYEDLNAIIQSVLASEYYKSRSDLQFACNVLTSAINLLKP